MALLSQITHRIHRQHFSKQLYQQFFFKESSFTEKLLMLSAIDYFSSALRTKLFVSELDIWKTEHIIGELSAKGKWSRLCMYWNTQNLCLHHGELSY